MEDARARNLYEMLQGEQWFLPQKALSAYFAENSDCVRKMHKKQLTTTLIKLK